MPIPAGLPRLVPASAGWAALLPALLFVPWHPSPVAGQTTGSLPLAPPGAAPPPSALLRLFFDCRTAGCGDLDYFRREVPWADWVRDPVDSDVHVLVTAEGMGGGGRRLRIHFRRMEEGLLPAELELAADESPDETLDGTRALLAGHLRVGLSVFVREPGALRVVPLGGIPGVGRSTPPPGPDPSGAGRDPWDHWVFGVRGTGLFTGEDRVRTRSWGAALTANRTTPLWKWSLAASRSTNASAYRLSSTTVTSRREDWNVQGLAVLSSSGRRSYGVRVGMGGSTYLNERLRWNVSPGIEWNLFPWSESSRRILTLQAVAHLRHFRYESITLFGKEQETRIAPGLHGALELIRGWGRASVTVDHSWYADAPERDQTALGVSIESRIARGFSVYLTGRYGRVRDQLNIPREDASDAEVLLQQRQLGTNDRYLATVGLSYRFGSIFNNVVNPRFGGGPGGLPGLIPF